MRCLRSEELIEMMSVKFDCPICHRIYRYSYKVNEKVYFNKINEDYFEGDRWKVLYRLHVAGILYLKMPEKYIPQTGIHE